MERIQDTGFGGEWTSAPKRELICLTKKKAPDCVVHTNPSLSSLYTPAAADAAAEKIPSHPFKTHTKTAHFKKEVDCWRS